MPSGLAFPNTIPTVERLPRAGAKVRVMRGDYGVQTLKLKPGRAISGARRTFWLRPDVQGYQARFRFVKPNGTNTSPLTFSITATPDSRGSVITEVGTDSTGLLRFKSTTEVQSNTITYTFTRSPVVGEKIDAVLPTVQFLQDLRAPNILEVSWEQGDFVAYGELPDRKAPLPESAMNYFEALSTLQTRSDKPIVVPDLSRLTKGDVEAVEEAAALIRGETVSSTWTRFTWKGRSANQSRRGNLPSDSGEGDEHEIDLGGHYQLRIVEPLIVDVGVVELVLGTVLTDLLSLRFVVEADELGALPYLNDTMHRTFAPDEPVPDRSHRPVLGKRLGPLQKSNTSVPSIEDHPPSASDEQPRNAPEALREKLLVEGLDKPVAVGLAFWHVADQNPGASIAAVGRTALELIRALINDGLFELGDYTSTEPKTFVSFEEATEQYLSSIEQADPSQFHTMTSREVGPFLQLTARGTVAARQLAEAGNPTARRRGRFHFVASGRSGRSDISERIDELLAAEVGQ